jgi:glucose dehydrogenase
VDATRLIGADQDPANWMTYGRTYSEQRFSPLAHITADDVNLLGLAWYADVDVDRGQDATPLIIEGVMYVSTAWAMLEHSMPRPVNRYGFMMPKCPAGLASTLRRRR